MAMNATNPKRYEQQLERYSNVKQEICDQVNRWTENAYEDKKLELQRASTGDFVCILLDINLY